MKLKYVIPIFMVLPIFTQANNDVTDERFKQLQAINHPTQVAKNQDPFWPCEQQFCQSLYVQAQQCYEHEFGKTQANPDQVVRAQLNYPEVLLAQGQYVKGFELFDARLAFRQPLQKPWDGSNPQGKKILVRCEYGLGDTFFFLRYVWALKAFGAQVVLLTQKPLKQVISVACPFVDLVINDPNQIPYYDAEIYLMSLPRYIEHDTKANTLRLAPTTSTTIPTFGPYMVAPSSFVEKWKALLPTNVFKIGICWRASALPAGQVRMLERDIPLALLAHIAHIPGVKLFSLLGKFNEPVRQRDALITTSSYDIIPNDYPTIYSFDSSFDNEGPFTDTMGLIANMDLVISVDTSIPNLAGAMGKPVWFLLPAQSDWRWGQETISQTPWHPSARLFWQTKQGDWDSVMNDVVSALKKFIK